MMRKAFTCMFLFLLGYAACLFVGPWWENRNMLESSGDPKSQSQSQPPPAVLPSIARDEDFYRFPSKCALPLPESSILSTVFKLFDNKSPYANFPPEHLRPYLLHNEIHGWGSTNPVFEKVIRLANPRVIIEVGTFLGNSALHMANVTRRLGLENTIILCMDDFRGWPGFAGYNQGMFRSVIDINGDVILMQQFMQNVVDAGEEERIIPMPFATGAGLDKLCLTGIYADLIEVDAGHSFHSAWEDINRAWKLLKPGGVMFGHDYFNGSEEYGVRRAVDKFAKEHNLRVEPNGEHWIFFPNT